MGSTSTITINTNLSSLTCQKYLSDATKGMNTAMERLSTGFKINSARDDAAGYSVVALMEAKVNGYDIIETNAQMGLDMLTTQEGVLDIMNDYLQRIRDLTMQAANGTYGSASLNAISLEVAQRMDEINRLCEITDFNDTYLLDGSRKEDINLQVGLYSDKRCVIKMDAFLFASAKSTIIMGFQTAANNTQEKPGYLDLRTSDTESDEYCYRARYINSDGKPTDAAGNVLPAGAEPVYKDGYYASALAAALAENGTIEYTAGQTSATLAAGQSFSIDAMCSAIYRNDSSARAFIDNIDDAIDNISLRCTKIGAYMNRLDSAIDSTDVQRENLVEATSTMKDADVAVESSNYIKYQILQQATASLLATANQQPQIALNLL
ncbi:MAG: flagellin [bacterium]|nr:flagellin [bacterium]